MLGDCTLTRVGVSGSNYNFCVKAHRRTVFTNLDRVYTMQFLVRLPGFRVLTACRCFSIDWA